MLDSIKIDSLQKLVELEDVEALDKEINNNEELHYVFELSVRLKKRAVVSYITDFELDWESREANRALLLVIKQNETGLLKQLIENKEDLIESKEIFQKVVLLKRFEMIEWLLENNYGTKELCLQIIETQMNRNEKEEMRLYIEKLNFKINLSHNLEINEIKHNKKRKI